MPPSRLLSPSLPQSLSFSFSFSPSFAATANSSCTSAQEDLNIAARRRSALAIEIYLAEIVDRLTRGDGARYNTLFVLRPYISLRRRIASAADEILSLNMGRISPRIVIFRPILRGPARVLHRASSDLADFLSISSSFFHPRCAFAFAIGYVVQRASVLCKLKSLVGVRL